MANQGSALTAHDALGVEEPEKKRIVVFGSGTFGTAMACVAARNGHEVIILTRRDEVANGINQTHYNPSHLTHVRLPENIASTTSSVQALQNADYIVHCIPIQGTEEFLEQVKCHIPHRTPMICCSKGIRARTQELLHLLLPRILGRDVPMAFLSGPTFAEPLARGTPSGAVVAAHDLKRAKECAGLFASSSFRVYPSTDVVGVEAAGALKNVFALLAGGLEGMGYGINTVSLLTTRASKEISRLAVAMGGREHTMHSVAGIGDLMLTTLGGSSRNKKVGYDLVASGKDLEDILDERRRSLQGVAEGVATAPAAARLALRLNVRSPLIETANSILQRDISPSAAVERLMLMPVHAERSVEEEMRRKRRRGQMDRMRMCIGCALVAISVIVGADRLPWSRGRKK